METKTGRASTASLEPGLAELGNSLTNLPGHNTEYTRGFRNWSILRVVTRLTYPSQDETPYKLITLDHDYTCLEAGHSYILWTVRQWQLHHDRPRQTLPFLAWHRIEHERTWRSWSYFERDLRSDVTAQLTCPVRLLDMTLPVNHGWRHQVRVFAKLPHKLRKRLVLESLV